MKTVKQPKNTMPGIGQLYPLGDVIKSVIRVEQVATARYRAGEGMTVQETTNAVIQLGYVTVALKRLQAVNQRLFN